MAARGLGAAAADRFRLGYVEPNQLDAKRHWHRMAIPYLTPTGIVQCRYRCLLPHHAKGQDDGGCPKFLGETGAPVTLYNARAAMHARGPLILCEGEPDVWAVETLAGLPAVGVPGAKAWEAHPYWARVFVGHDLILASDGDDAGDHLATVVAKALPETKIVRLPDGDDANSVLARDPDEFLHRCGLGQPVAGR